jgi:hypothetical protein
MMLTTRSRRDRATLAKITILGTATVLLFTPRMEIDDFQRLISLLPLSTPVQSDQAR